MQAVATHWNPDQGRRSGGCLRSRHSRGGREEGSHFLQLSTHGRRKSRCNVGHRRSVLLARSPGAEKQQPAGGRERARARAPFPFGAGTGGDAVVGRPASGGLRARSAATEREPEGWGAAPEAGRSYAGAPPRTGCGAWRWTRSGGGGYCEPGECAHQPGRAGGRRGGEGRLRCLVTPSDAAAPELLSTDRPSLPLRAD